MSKQKIVVLSGAGVSADSGLKTFRDMGGLWEGYDVMEVASPGGWQKNPELVLGFYNERRRQLIDAKCNDGHLALAKLETKYDVTIITQNVDNLHEQAGSTNIIHLHGILTKSQSTADPSLVYEINGTELNVGDKCEKGSQLRPYIVWFGEMVPMMDEAIPITEKADIFIVVGTSLEVYPAAGLINYVPEEATKYVVDPKIPTGSSTYINTIFIEERAAVGVPKLVDKLLS
ncbi:MAG: NAD-dependent deacylase [Bacteroidia bacterium]|nr:NAD-dependent deacylase [Bacteroidia bacterium]